MQEHRSMVDPAYLPQTLYLPSSPLPNYRQVLDDHRLNTTGSHSRCVHNHNKSFFNFDHYYAVSLSSSLLFPPSYSSHFLLSSSSPSPPSSAPPALPPAFPIKSVSTGSCDRVVKLLADRCPNSFARTLESFL